MNTAQAASSPPQSLSSLKMLPALPLSAVSMNIDQVQTDPINAATKGEAIPLYIKKPSNA